MTKPGDKIQVRNAEGIWYNAIVTDGMKKDIFGNEILTFKFDFVGGNGNNGVMPLDKIKTHVRPR